jgi:hypothetical protein
MGERQELIRLQKRVDWLEDNCISLDMALQNEKASKEDWRAQATKAVKREQKVLTWLENSIRHKPETKELQIQSDTFKLIYDIMFQIHNIKRANYEVQDQ